MYGSGSGFAGLEGSSVIRVQPRKTPTQMAKSKVTIPETVFESILIGKIIVPDGGEW